MGFGTRLTCATVPGVPEKLRQIQAFCSLGLPGWCVGKVHTVEHVRINAVNAVCQCCHCCLLCCIH